MLTQFWASYTFLYEEREFPMIQVIILFPGRDITKYCETNYYSKTTDIK